MGCAGGGDEVRLRRISRARPAVAALQAPKPRPNAPAPPFAILLLPHTVLRLSRPADAAVDVKIVPMVQSLHVARQPDTLIVHAFADTAEVVHGVIDGFARSGSVARVEAASQELVIRASVPLRGDSASVVVRVGLVGDPDLSHHCLVTEPETRMGSAGSRFELRDVLQRLVTWLRDERFFEVESESSQGSIGEPVPVSRLPHLDVGLLFGLSADGATSKSPPGLESRGPGEATATLMDATNAQLADFVRAGPAAGSANTTSAVLGAFAESAAPESVYPALATRAVEAAKEAGVVPSPSDSAASPGQSPPARPASAHTDTVPSDEDIRSARPAARPAGRGQHSAAVRQDETEEKEEEEEESGAAGTESCSLLFADSSSHIRSCLQAGASQTPRSQPTAADMAKSLAPLAGAMGSQFAQPRRQAVTAAARLVLAQETSVARGRVTEALSEAGFTRQLGALLAAVAKSHLESEAARGGPSATRSPEVALAVVEAAASASGFAVEDLNAALRAALALGGNMGQLCPLPAGLEAADGKSSAAAASRSALRDSLTKWASLPDGAGASLAHLQRIATEFMDLVTDDEDVDDMDF